MLNNIYLIIGIVLGILNIYQFLSQKEKEKSIKSLVRSWQNHVEGIKNALLQLAVTPGHLLSKDKMYGSIQVLSQQAASLDKAMVEERFYKDKEIKDKREDNEKYYKELLNTHQVNPAASISSK